MPSNGILPMDASIGMYEDLSFLVPDNMKIPLEAIRLDTEIGHGHFGRVFRATLVGKFIKSEEAVAVKTLHGI